MPRSPSRRSAGAVKALEEESKIAERLQNDPELIGKIHDHFTSGRQKMQAGLEDLAETLGCSVDSLKKTYLRMKLKGGDDTKKAKEQTERPKSARSSEPKETRRSLRLNKDLANGADSAENSCASSVCGSPRSSEEANVGSRGKDQQQQQLQQTPQSEPPRRFTRARSLAAITEDETNLNATVAMLEEAAAKPDSTINDDAEASATAEHGSRSAAVDDQPQQQQQQHHHQATPSASEARQTRSMRGQQSEPSTSSRESRAQQQDKPSVGSARRGSQTSGNMGNAGGRSLRGGPNGQPRGGLSPDDPTKVFFDSMGLTVMSFPQHIQAQVKSKVSSLVHELEYELYSPADKATAVA